MSIRSENEIKSKTILHILLIGFLFIMTIVIVPSYYWRLVMLLLIGVIAYFMIR